MHKKIVIAFSSLLLESICIKIRNCLQAQILACLQKHFETKVVLDNLIVCPRFAGLSGMTKTRICKLIPTIIHSRNISRIVPRWSHKETSINLYTLVKLSFVTPMTGNASPLTRNILIHYTKPAFVLP